MIIALYLLDHIGNIVAIFWHRMTSIGRSGYSRGHRHGEGAAAHGTQAEAGGNGLG